MFQQILDKCSKRFWIKFSKFQRQIFQKNFRQMFQKIFSTNIHLKFLLQILSKDRPMLNRQPVPVAFLVITISFLWFLVTWNFTFQIFLQNSCLSKSVCLQQACQCGGRVGVINVEVHGGGGGVKMGLHVTIWCANVTMMVVGGVVGAPQECRWWSKKW